MSKNHYNEPFIRLDLTEIHVGLINGCCMHTIIDHADALADDPERSLRKDEHTLVNPLDLVCTCAECDTTLAVDWPDGYVWLPRRPQFKTLGEAGGPLEVH